MKRRLLHVFGAAVIGSAFMMSGGAPAGASRVIIVRPGQSIQAAVDAARPGTTIIVKRGTYAENVAITKDGIKLLGEGATLVPPAAPQPNACSFGGPATDGICAFGDVDFPDDAPPIVNDPVSDVRISGFTVAGFEGTGIIFVGAERPMVTHNRTRDNAEYGIARFVSTGGRIVGNSASGSEEAGIYVGDSPEANVLIAANRTFDNEFFGFFLRDAANGLLIGNRSSGNCIGALVLNTGPNVAGTGASSATSSVTTTTSARPTQRRALRHCRASAWRSPVEPTTPSWAIASSTTHRPEMSCSPAVSSCSMPETRAPTHHRAMSCAAT